MSLPLPTLDSGSMNISTSHNVAPAANQVTSSQILLEAHESKRSTFKKPAQDIKDLDELRLFQLTKRRNFEQQLNKNRLNYNQWMRYAKWEIEENHDFKRGRSILERALEVNVQHVPFWVRYIELELLYKNVNHARNLLNRAVSILPRTDKFWFMYVQVEESLANYQTVREIFERWLTWKPIRGAWEAYAAFEVRYSENDNARALYKRYVANFNDAESWLRWIEFETGLSLEAESQVALIRGVFEAGVDKLLELKSVQEDPRMSDFVCRWIEWEASVSEKERSHAIFSRFLEADFLLKDQKLLLVRKVKTLQTNSSEILDGNSFLLKRKLHFERNVVENPRDYDSWWELAKIEEKVALTDSVVAVLTKAVAVEPQEQTKLILWRRYIFLWIKLALKYEFDCHDSEQAKQTWKKALGVVPHDKFTFAKVWIMFADFLIRCEKHLGETRKVLGRAIGEGCLAKPKAKLFGYYINLEKKVGETDRVRKIYDKWLEVAFLFDKSHGTTLASYALEQYIQFELSMNESERCIELYKIGIDEHLAQDWTILLSFIEFLKDEFRYEEARELLREQVKANDEPALWTMLALFESSILSPNQIEQLEELGAEEASFELEDHHISQTRSVFEEAYNHYKKENNGKSATEIIDSWKDYEAVHGTEDALSKVEAKRPKLVSKRKDVDGISEEYYEYEFPGPKISKFLANARKWAGSS